MELVQELREQTGYMGVALVSHWSARWVKVLLDWLMWDPQARQPTKPSAGVEALAHHKGAPTVVEGEILPGFPGVAAP